MVCGAEDRAVVGDQSAAVVRVFDMLIERLGRMEDGLGRLGAYMGRLGAYMGQRAEELPAGSEVGAELELELEQEQELEEFGQQPLLVVFHHWQMPLMFQIQNWIASPHFA